MTAPLPLRPYQIADLSFLISQKKALMLHDPGGGKTPPVCVWLWYHWDSNHHKSVWVMPKSLMHKNKRELLRFTHFTADDICLVEKEVDLANQEAKVYIMTPARFRISHLEIPPEVNVLAADEPHMYWTNNDTAVTQALYEVAETMDYFVGMTGTLIKGRLNSCYPMIHVIEPRYYPSYQGFMNHHAILDAWNNVIGWKNPERISAVIGKHAIKRTFESIYGKEAKVIQTQLCQMSADQRKSYDEFEAKAIIELNDSFLTGSTGGVFALRCRQIMAHPETYGLGTSGKDDMLKVHLADHANSGKPLIIFAAFKAEQRRIEKLVLAQKLTCGLLNSDTSGKERARIDAAFVAGNIQVLVGSPLVAAVGYNWQDAGGFEVEHMIFTTLDYGDDTFVQGYRRAVRGVRKSALLIDILEYEDSIDQKVFAIVKRKSALGNSVDADKEIFDLSVA